MSEIQNENLPQQEAKNVDGDQEYQDRHLEEVEQVREQEISNEDADTKDKDETPASPRSISSSESESSTNRNQEVANNGGGSPIDSDAEFDESESSPSTPQPLSEDLLNNFNFTRVRLEYRLKRQALLRQMEEDKEEEDSQDSEFERVKLIGLMGCNRKGAGAAKKAKIAKERDESHSEIDEIVAEWRATRHTQPVSYHPWNSDLQKPSTSESASTSTSENYPGITLKPSVEGSPQEHYCFTCAICNMIFFQKTDFTKHLFEEHRSQTRDDVWNCADCQLNFAQESKYLRHFELFEHVAGRQGMLGEPKKKLKCPLCEILFEQWDWFVHHWERDHPKVEKSSGDGDASVSNPEVPTSGNINIGIPEEEKSGQVDPEAKVQT